MEKGMKEIHVIKRNGEQETLDLDKIHVMVEHACRGLAGVSESQVEMNANLQFFDGIETAAIQEILVRSANDLISLEAPNYQFVAARLLLFGLRKAVYNGHPDGHPPLYDHVQTRDVATAGEDSDAFARHDRVPSENVVRKSMWTISGSNSLFLGQNSQFYGC
jgi:hypothetical protein